MTLLLKKWILILVLSVLISETQQATDCQISMLNAMKNTTILLKQFMYSGKYFNELGDYT